MFDDRLLSIWDRLLSSGPRAIPAEASRYLLQLGLGEGDRTRMEDLAERCQNGTLTQEERAELDAYSHAAAFLTILQSKARSSIRSIHAVSGNGAPAA